METNKICAAVRDQFLDLHTPAKGLSSAPQAAEHVSQCAECAHVWKSFSETMAVLETWQVPEPSPFFATRLRANIDELELQINTSASSSWEHVQNFLTGRHFFGLRTWQPVMAGILAIALILGVSQYKKPLELPTVDETLMRSSGVHDLNKLQLNQDVYAGMDVLDDLPNSDDMQAPNTGTNKDSSQKDTTEM
jgi:hypothetical protein